MWRASINLAKSHVQQFLRIIDAKASYEGQFLRRCLHPLTAFIFSLHSAAGCKRAKRRKMSAPFLPFLKRKIQPASACKKSAVSVLSRIEGEHEAGGLENLALLDGHKRVTEECRPHVDAHNILLLQIGRAKLQNGGDCKMWKKSCCLP